MRDYEIETWAPYFEDIKINTMIIYEGISFSKLRTSSSSSFMFLADCHDMFHDMHQGDLLRISDIYQVRPREILLESLRTQKTIRVRVDNLLDWHDNEIITILPS
jgi:hypothetical protein